jgi:hypothetical protein
MMNEKEERSRAGNVLRSYADKIPSSLRAPLMAVRDGTEIPGTLEGVMEFVDQWLETVEE